jgi:hypothetical protein
MLGNRGSRLYLYIRASRRSVMLDMEDFVYGDRYARSEVYIDRDTQGVKQSAYLLSKFRKRSRTNRKRYFKGINSEMQIPKLP